MKKDAIAGGAKVMASLSMDEDDDAGVSFQQLLAVSLGTVCHEYVLVRTIWTV